jgi:trimethylamine:corrinoid methyltransferase-like protein
VEQLFAEIRCIAEGREDVNERSLMLFSPSPMILDADDLYLCFKPGTRITSFMVGSMPMAGMTGPADPVAIYMLALAEVLGAAAILHAILPGAKAYLYPHPQSMDPRTGQMAFGTREHARLEMMKMQVMHVLGLSYYAVKDIMTSAQMPGSMAQGDKALGIYTGIMAGYRAFNLMPLSTDQVWSPVQLLLDVEALEDAWAVLRTRPGKDAVSSGLQSILHALDNRVLFAETDDTLLNLDAHFNLDPLHVRYFTAELWQAAGRPPEYEAVARKAADLVRAWDYRPDMDRMEKMIRIYRQLCRKFHADPLELT